MELLKEVLLHVMEKEEIRVSFPNVSSDLSVVAESVCYKALQKIKTIMDNDSLSDFECVEEIVCVLEEIGSDGGSRHDFG